MSVKKVDQLVIAERASELFIQRGFTNTSLSEIGEACGVLKGSLYHHFENKEHILLFILERLRSDLGEYVFSIADSKDLPAPQRLKQINNFLKDYFLEKRACLIAMISMESDLISEDARKIMNGIFQDWKQAYVKIFKNYHTPYMAEIHATNSIIFIEGAIVWMRITQENLPLKRAFKSIEQNLKALEDENTSTA
jgi:TetR/AcrR family transcriptional repressor of lmrAB and yxaGH operons